MNTNHDYTNIQFWNELSDIHAEKSDYNLDQYHPENYSLRDVELNLMGDLSGKCVLHLQCHIGLDSFALEKLGAEVTAIDYSISAINIANKIKDKFSLNTQFHCASVYDLTTLNLNEFDIVFTSYGVLIWLDNLSSWANTISSHLKEGGLFYIVDEHPTARIFSNPKEDSIKFNNGHLHPYWNENIPTQANYKYSYASNEKELVNQQQFIWPHSLSEIINSLLISGLDINHFTEYDKTFYQAFSDLTLHEDNWWRFENKAYSIPLTFSLSAKKRKLG